MTFLLFWFGGLALIGLVLYGGVGFNYWQFNPGKWPESTREELLFAWLFIGTLFSLILWSVA